MYTIGTIALGLQRITGSQGSQVFLASPSGVASERGSQGADRRLRTP